MDFDVLVVGAGPAGCLAARGLARAGLRVGLFDANEHKNLGQKVAVEIETSIFSKVACAMPQGEEIPYHGKCLRTFSPAGRPGFVLEGAPIVAVYLDRFVKKLLAEAKQAGAQFFGGRRAQRPLMRDGAVAGVAFETQNGAEEIYARLVVDATGFNAALVQKLDPDLGIDVNADPQDVFVAENHLHAVDIEEAEKAIREGRCQDEEIWSILGKDGSYSTEFFHLSLAKKRAYILIGLKESYDIPVSKLIERFRAQHTYYKKRLYGDRGRIRVSRSLPRLVADGFLVLGEAASMVIPLHGSGVASGMWAGHLAAAIAGPVLKSGAPTTEALWPFAYFYQKDRGALLATYDVVRRVTETFAHEQIGSMVENGVSCAEDLYSASVPKRMDLTLATLPQRMRGLIRHPDLIPKIGHMAALAALVDHHWSSYPRYFDPERFAAWKRRDRDLFEPLSAGR